MNQQKTNCSSNGAWMQFVQNNETKQKKKPNISLYRMWSFTLDKYKTTKRGVMVHTSINNIKTYQNKM